MTVAVLARPSLAELTARAQAAQTRLPAPSPCTSVCQMNPNTGWCEGCFRTIDEIIQWSAMTDATKQAVWRQLPERRAQVSP